MNDLEKSAVQAAIKGDWQLAIEINEEIIDSFPDNIQARNRLAYAYMQSGDHQRAKKLYEDVLEQEPDHPIAAKNVVRAQQLGKKSAKERVSDRVHSDPDVFIKEPGKTRQTVLINTAERTVLNSLQTGQEVKLIVKKNTVGVRTVEGEYIGALPDDLSFLLKKLIGLGNGYQAHIRKIHSQKVYIFIREIKRGKKVRQATFRHSLLINF